MKKLIGLLFILLALSFQWSYSATTFEWLDDMEPDDAYQDPLYRGPSAQSLLQSRGKLEYSFPLGMVIIPGKYVKEPDYQFLFMHGELFDIPAGSHFNADVQVADVLGLPAFSSQKLAESHGWSFNKQNRFERGQVVLIPDRKGNYFYGVVLGFRPNYDELGKPILMPSAGKWLVQIAPFQLNIFNAQDLGK
ncbi:MAG TPA: hypothetical protein VFF04_03755 [Candidatus Babeliales bacterium]|nr:hypothetical protein [Candidatus Babeliales bacterium]